MKNCRAEVSVQRRPKVAMHFVQIRGSEVARSDPHRRMCAKLIGFLPAWLLRKKGRARQYFPSISSAQFRSTMEARQVARFQVAS